MTHTPEVGAFRPYAVDDPAALALLDEYFDMRRAGFPTTMGSYRRVDPDPADFAHPNGVFLIIAGPTITGERGNIGCGGVRHIPHSPGVTRFEIKHLWIQPHARGRGVGRRLLDELEWRALAFGGSEVVLDTNATQVEAAALYRSAGYIEIPSYNGNANATHWFAKNLTTELE